MTELNAFSFKLTNWQKRMVEDIFQIDSSVLTIDREIMNNGAPPPYGVPGNDRLSRIYENQRMYLTDEQIRMLKKTCNIICRYINLTAGAEGYFK